MKPNFKVLYKCFKEMAYDNGVINRFFTEDQLLERFILEFDNPENQNFKNAELELIKFNEDEILEICIGDSDHPIADMISTETNEVLEMLFENL